MKVKIAQIQAHVYEEKEKNMEENLLVAVDRK